MQFCPGPELIGQVVVAGKFFQVAVIEFEPDAHGKAGSGICVAAHTATAHAAWIMTNCAMVGIAKGTGKAGGDGDVVSEHQVLVQIDAEHTHGIQVLRLTELEVPFVLFSADVEHHIHRARSGDGGCVHVHVRREVEMPVGEIVRSTQVALDHGFGPRAGLQAGAAPEIAREGDIGEASAAGKLPHQGYIRIETILFGRGRNGGLGPEPEGRFLRGKTVGCAIRFGLHIEERSAPEAAEGQPRQEHHTRCRNIYIALHPPVAVQLVAVLVAGIPELGQNGCLYTNRLEIGIDVPDEAVTVNRMLVPEPDRPLYAHRRQVRVYVDRVYTCAQVLRVEFLAVHIVLHGHLHAEARHAADVFTQVEDYIKIDPATNQLSRLGRKHRIPDVVNRYREIGQELLLAGERPAADVELECVFIVILRIVGEAQALESQAEVYIVDGAQLHVRPAEGPVQGHVECFFVFIHIGHHAGCLGQGDVALEQMRRNGSGGGHGELETDRLARGLGIVEQGYVLQRILQRVFLAHGQAHFTLNARLGERSRHHLHMYGIDARHKVGHVGVRELQHVGSFGQHGQAHIVDDHVVNGDLRLTTGVRLPRFGQLHFECAHVEAAEQLTGFPLIVFGEGDAGRVQYIRKIVKNAVGQNGHARSVHDFGPLKGTAQYQVGP